MFNHQKIKIKIKIDKTKTNVQSWKLLHDKKC